MGMDELNAAPPPVTTDKCEFQSDGVRCRGWFYAPDAEPPYPCVVMAHGFGASPDGPLGDIGRRLAGAGLAAFAFDYRQFGESDGQPRQVIEMRRQLDDWHAALTYVRSRDDVDFTQLGLWGSSMSGGQVLAVAARDPGLAAAVAQVPYADGHSLARAAGLRRHFRMLPAVLTDLLRDVAGRRPYMIAGIASPGRTSAFSAGPALYDTMVQQAPSWRNEIAARSLLQLYRFRPVREARQIRCPLLVVVTYRDGVAPADVVMRAAQELPYVELAMFPAEHFDLYAGDTYERAVRTEIRFLQHQFARRRGEPTVQAVA